jgi:hypothetical protein
VREIPMSLACVPAPSPARFEPAGGAVPGAERIHVWPTETGARVMALSPGAPRYAASGAGLTASGGASFEGASAGDTTTVVDGDGDCGRDAVAVGGGRVTLWRLTASDVSAPEVQMVAGARAAAPGDVDGDGRMDLIVVGGAQARALQNDGTGRFSELAGAFDAAPSDATAVGAADLDGDGHIDVVIGQGDVAAAPPRVYLNDRQGTGHFAFASGALAPRPDRARAIALADLDADGDVDLVMGFAGAPVRVFLNRGNAFLEDRSFASLPDMVARDLTALVVQDVNGDCLPDLVIAHAGGAPLVWLNGAGARFSAGQALPVADARDVAVEDVNGDSLPDLIVAGASGVQVLVQR